MKISNSDTISANAYPYQPPISPKIKNGCVTIPNTSNLPLGISSIVDNGPATEDDLMLLLLNEGPQIVAIYASQNFQLYQSGVFTDTACYTGNCYLVNHAVLVIGYGTDPVGGDYWLVRNSWVNSIINFLNFI